MYEPRRTSTDASFTVGTTAARGRTKDTPRRLQARGEVATTDIAARFERTSYGGRRCKTDDCERHQDGKGASEPNAGKDARLEDRHLPLVEPAVLRQPRVEPVDQFDRCARNPEDALKRVDDTRHQGARRQVPRLTPRFRVDELPQHGDPVDRRIQLQHDHVRNDHRPVETHHAGGHRQTGAPNRIERANQKIAAALFRSTPTSRR